MTPAGTERAPAGWYSDPWGSPLWRWWDGHSWTPYLWPGAAVVSDLRTEEQKAAPYAKAAFVCWVLVLSGSLLIAWAGAHQERAAWDAMRMQLQDHDLNSGERVHVPLFGFNDVIAPFQLLVYAGLLVWQFRAAKTARAVFYPARHSPALGAWGWIIPVVNLWFPYQALRDCLPPGDPARGDVVRMWTCYICMMVLQIAAVVLITLGLFEGTIVGSLAVALAIGFGFLGIGTVNAIADSHSRSLHIGSLG